MRRLLIWIMILGPVLSYSQSVNYEIFENDMDKINNFHIAFTPISIEGWTGAAMESWFGYRAQASYRMGNFGSVTYTYRPQFNGGVEDVSGNSPQQFGFSEFLLTKGFGTKATRGKVKMNLSSSQSGNTRTTTYIMVDADYIQVTDMRVGLLNYSTILEFAKADEDPMYNLTMRGTALNLGMQFGDINRVKMNSDYGKKKNLKSTIYYFDVLYAPRLAIDQQNLDDILALDGELPAMNKSRFGFRYGLNFASLNNLGFSGGVEIGWRPTIRPEEDSAWNRFYLGFTGSWPLVAFRAPSPFKFN